MLALQTTHTPCTHMHTVEVMALPSHADDMRQRNESAVAVGALRHCVLARFAACVIGHLVSSRARGWGGGGGSCSRGRTAPTPSVMSCRAACGPPGCPRLRRREASRHSAPLTRGLASLSAACRSAPLAAQRRLLERVLSGAAPSASMAPLRRLSEFARAASSMASAPSAASTAPSTAAVACVE